MSMRSTSSWNSSSQVGGQAQVAIGDHARPQPLRAVDAEHAFDEVVELMKDLRAVSCDIMTIGQYLQPYERRLPVERYVTPEEFARYREVGMSLGFHHVESSPLTRSSYHARQQVEGAVQQEPEEALASAR